MMKNNIANIFKIKVALIELTYSYIIQLLFTSFALFLVAHNFSLDDSLLMMGKLGTSFYLSSIAINLFSSNTLTQTQYNAALGFFITAIGLLCFVNINSITVLIGACCVGMGYGLTKPALPVIFAEIIKDTPLRESGFSLFYGLGNIGALLGPLVIGMVSKESYVFFYITSSFLSFVLCLIILPSLKEIKRINKNIILYMSIFLCLAIFIAGNKTASFLFLTFIIGYVCFRKKIFQDFKKFKQKSFLGHALILYILLEQRFFLIQKYVELNIDKPFGTSVLYALNSGIVIVGIIIITQWRAKISVKIPKTWTEGVSLSYLLLSSSFLCLFIGNVYGGRHWSWVVIMIILSSFAEISFIPKLIETLSTRFSEKKTLGMAALYMIIGTARFFTASLVAYIQDFQVAFLMLSIVPITIYFLMKYVKRQVAYGGY
jgi:hypothetical protein